MPKDIFRRFTATQTKKWWTNLERRVSSAGVFCETPDGNLLIVKASYKKHWSIPGGIVDAHETPILAAIRETREEVGISLDPERLEFVAVIDRSSKVANTYQFVFRAKVTHEQIKQIKLQVKEIDEFELITREEVLNEADETGRHIGKVIYHWAHGRSGYIEQTFNLD